MSRVVDDPDLRERVQVFEDRFHAGRVLAEMLREHVLLKNSILLAVPAGGVPVGYEVSTRLSLQMDLIIVRKLQIPWDPEAGFGAISWDGEMVLNEELVRRLELTQNTIQKSAERAMESIRARIKRFRKDEPMPKIRGKVAVLVDDGLASGYTMLAAARSVKKMEARGIVVAVPTASMNAIKLLSREVDLIICPNVRSGLIFAVADAYRSWHDLTDEEVLALLEKPHNPKSPSEKSRFI